MNKKLVAIVFAILFLAGAIPFKFTATPGLYVFGWLPVSLLYWWGLMAVNLVFVLLVCRAFVKDSEKENKEEAKK